MKTKILLDTSAWICSFRKEGFEKLKEQVKAGSSGFSVLGINMGSKNA